MAAATGDAYAWNGSKASNKINNNDIKNNT